MYSKTKTKKKKMKEKECPKCGMVFTYDKKKKKDDKKLFCPNCGFVIKILPDVRKVAKVWSIISIGFLSLMIVGHLFFPEETEALPTLVEAIAMLFFPTGVLAGMAISWKWEKIGAIITIVSLLVFYMLIIIPRGAYRAIPITLLLAVPGFLFLICSLLSRNLNKTKK